MIIASLKGKNITPCSRGLQEHIISVNTSVKRDILRRGCSNC